MAKKILLSERFGDNIFTRNTISAFFEDTNKLEEKEIVFDFSGVEFISRSCADEYLKKKQASMKKITEVNISERVNLMLNAVKKQYEKSGFNVSTNSFSKKLIPA